ncbi:hypothetical protein E8E12_011184 [Didymella heteroderae]|uniref:Uncharacterized protein n=1 Tax=Didymella heteroderae TaxID=1769908 RepID=A0A9P4X127_9PLEO|nr:hypothetical protein E8E12_011184 [Didymella heteroderae]
MKPANKQKAQESLWNGKHAPKVSEQNEEERETSQDSQQAAKEEKSKGVALQFEAGGTSTLPTSIKTAGPRDGTSPTVALKCKSVTGEDTEKLKRVQALRHRSKIEGAQDEAQRET